MSDRSIVQESHAKLWDLIYCKYDRIRGHKGRAFMKREANRRARRALNRDLQQRASDAMADIARSKRAS